MDTFSRCKEYIICLISFSKFSDILPAVTFKNKTTAFFCSGIVYSFTCSGCSGASYGETNRHFKVRMCEHLGVPALTGKRVKRDNGSVDNDKRTSFIL